jgi:alpha-1,3-mannosyltransferase
VSVLIFVVTQIALSLPFWMSGFGNEYVSRAFEFSRAFEYKWTVNWRFVSHETFGTKSFARALLVAHVVGLLLFAHKKWYVSAREEKEKARQTRKDSLSVRTKTRAERFFFGFFADWFRRLPRDASPSTTVELSLADPAHVMSTLHEGVFIGVVFARSLHYQFYAWYFHSLPFLLWRCDFFEAAASLAFRSETAVRLASDTARVSLLLLIERSWNIFPATEESSRTLFAAHAVLLAGLFFSRRRVKSVRAAEKNDKNA